MSSSGVSIDKVFTKRLADLEAAVKNDGEQLESYGTTQWLKLYSDKSGEDGKVLNGLDPAEFVAAFDRTELNSAYLKLAQPNSEAVSYRDAQVAKVQLDVLAGMERDLRMRYRSRVRMLAHGVARLQSHGLSIGPINRGIVNFVKLLADKTT